MTYGNRSERLQREIDDAIADGWRIESETPERVVLVKRNLGSIGVHLILAVLTGWWSFGVVNLVYGAYKYLNDSQRRVLRDGAACPECGASVAPNASYCQNCGTGLDSEAVGFGTDAATETETTRRE
ncbi:zinc ribbon domain-containing protein [Halorussus lipolyticus]|uniref:zinc ribbon domain-containing protein n=1 Tax=Halorussus lipolyticus TaxID=3034024 RepID=UPI0023E796AC|nr:zinc ribbon domain-containing protein [Halorussus sp. DT80]